MSDDSMSSGSSAPADTGAPTAPPPADGGAGASPPAASPDGQHVSLADVYLPEDIRSDSAIGPIKTVTDLAKQAIHASRMVGADKLTIPGKDATEEDWVNAFAKLGRPDTPDGYNIKSSEALPEGTISPDRMKSFAEFMHSKGAPAKLVQDIVAWHEGMVIEDIKSIEQGGEKSKEETSRQLASEYGNAVEAKLKMANRAFGNLKSGEAALAKIKGAGLANDIDIVKMAIELGEHMGEDRLIGLEDQARGIAMSMTPQMAEAKINELKADPEFHKAWTDRYHPGHASAMEKITKLQKDAYPNE